MDEGGTEFQVTPAGGDSGALAEPGDQGTEVPKSETAIRRSPAGDRERQAAESRRQREEIGQLKQQLRRLEEQDGRQTRAGCRLPEDRPLKGHQFGLRMIVGLAVNLARVVGLRPSERVLKIVWEWLGVKQRLPDWTTIRTWLLRVGVASPPRAPRIGRRLGWDGGSLQSNRPREGAGRPGRAGLAIATAGRNPPADEDVRLLMVRPGTAWKREDMGTVYRELAEQYGNHPALCCAMGQ